MCGITALLEEFSNLHKKLLIVVNEILNIFAVWIDIIDEDIFDNRIDSLSIELTTTGNVIAVISCLTSRSKIDAKLK